MSTATIEKAEAPTKTLAAPKRELFDLSSLAPIEKPRPMSKKFSMVLYGVKGAGKSSLAGSCAMVEELSPVLFLATEDGSSVLARDYGDDPNLDVINIEDWRTAAPIIQAVADNETKYKTVVVDTIAELQEFMKAHSTNDGATAMEFKDWGYLADNTVKIVKLLHRSEWVNVIFTTHTEKVKDEDSGKVLSSPYFLGKKSLSEALKPIDIVAYLGVTQDKATKETLRVLQTGTDGKFDASDRSGKLDMFIANPSFAEIHAQLTK